MQNELVRGVRAVWERKASQEALKKERSSSSTRLLSSAGDPGREVRVFL